MDPGSGAHQCPSTYSDHVVRCCPSAARSAGALPEGALGARRLARGHGLIRAASACAHILRSDRTMFRVPIRREHAGRPTCRDTVKSRISINRRSA